MTYNTLPERPNFIDYAKVIAIYCVVLGHYTYALDYRFENSPLWNIMHIITLFHMPFFFIVSGMLYKKTVLGVTISKGWIQLLKPYFMMSIMISVIMLCVVFFTQGFSYKYILKVLLGIISANDLPMSVGNWSSALWFCYSLFIIKIIYAFLIQYRWGGYLSFVVCIMGICLMHVGYKLPMRFDSSLVGFIFFYIGVSFSKLVRKIQDVSSRTKIVVSFVALIVLCISAYYNLNLNQKQALSINAMHYGPYPLLFLLSGVSGATLILTLSSFLRSMRNIVILTISNGTIVVLGFHWTIYKLFFGWWISTCNVVIAMLVAIADLILCYFLILFFSKYCPAILGNRNLK